MNTTDVQFSVQFAIREAAMATENALAAAKADLDAADAADATAAIAATHSSIVYQKALAVFQATQNAHHAAIRAIEAIASTSSTIN